MTATTDRGSDVAALIPDVVSRCEDKLGEQATWINPTGYPDGLALCLLDAIWSLGVNYDKHVIPVLDRYRAARRASGGDPSTDGTAELLAAVAGAGGPIGFAGLVQNHQRTSTHAGAPLKAEAVMLAAHALSSLGISDAQQFCTALAEERIVLRQAWKSVPGQRSSDIGWRYLQLLVGEDSVKPDRMIEQFLQACGGVNLTHSQMVTVVAAAAATLGVPARVLDHAIWRYQRAL